MPAGMDMDTDMGALVVSLADLARAPRPHGLVGGKAANLGRLLAAGVPVPAGWVLTTQAHALPAAGRDAAIAALAAAIEAAGVRSPLAVRSSSTMEDRPGAAAPGLFASRLGVAARDLAAAVHAVWASAGTPLVRAYAEARQGVPGGHIGMAVIVQPAIAGQAAGVAYTRLPGRPQGDEMLIESYARPGAPAAALRLARDGRAQDTTGFPVAPARVARLVRAVLDAEAAIGAGEGADVEWVVDGDAVWIVQARPVVHPRAAPAPAFPTALLAFSRATPGIVWRWDVGHNPDPLSPAQAGLVERMDAAGASPYRMRVVGGYLYYGRAPAPPDATSRELPAPPDATSRELPAPPDATSRELPAPPDATLGAAPDGSALTAEALRQRFDTVWLPAMEAALAQAEASDAELDRVLAAYERFYAVYAGELTAWLGAARRALPAFLARHGAGADGVDTDALAGALLTDPSDARLETWIARVARGAATFEQLMALAGPMSPAWDVAVPTFAERPALLRRAVAAAARAGRPAENTATSEQATPAAHTATSEQATPAARTATGEQATPAERARAQVDARLAPAQREAFARCLALARAARDLGERDDQLFARAQAAVRRALLGLAHAWGLPAPEDIFFVPLDQVRAWAAAGPPPVPAVRRLAQAGRTARERQRAWAMPLAFADGAPVVTAVAPAPRDADTWRGRGTGGRARGIAVRVADLGDITARADDADGAAADAGLPAGAILIVPTLTPAMTVLLHGAGAVVAQHGGLLDHGAAMARELGLPCVVDCAGVWNEVRAGDTLLVDGEAGLVLRLAARQTAQRDEDA
jgi:pyruvate,water dikinase